MSFYNSRKLWCAWKQGQALLRRGMDYTHNIIMVLHGLLSVLGFIVELENWLPESAHAASCCQIE